jgi:hypothetical protein
MKKVKASRAVSAFYRPKTLMIHEALQISIYWLSNILFRLEFIRIVAPKVAGSIPVDLTSPNFRQLDALSSVRSQQGAETQSGLFCTIETMRAPRWLACLMLGSGPQHASFLYTLVSSIRSSPGPTRLRPGGMDTQNWKAMFADRESDDEN